MASVRTSPRSSTPSTADHPTGVAWGAENETCGTCAWASGRRCRASGKRIDPGWRACAMWEGALDCLACAACCGPAYDAVELRRGDVRHPDFAIVKDGRAQIARTATNHCSALGEGNLCAIYSERPRCCRDFEKGGWNCLDARRRSGKSPRWPSERVDRGDDRS
jgi:Fe-S-cluster containining protein